MYNHSIKYRKSYLYIFATSAIIMRIIKEVKTGLKHWKSIATRLGIAKREVDVFEHVFQRSLK